MTATHKHSWWIDYMGDRFCTDCSAMGMPVGLEQGNKEYVQCPCTGRTHKKGCQWYGWTFKGKVDLRTGMWQAYPRTLPCQDESFHGRTLFFCAKRGVFWELGMEDFQS